MLDEVKTELKELLSVMYYYKFEIYFIERMDLDNAAPEMNEYSKSFLIDFNQPLFEGIWRFCKGIGNTHPYLDDLSVPSVFMGYFEILPFPFYDFFNTWLVVVALRIM